MRPLAFKRYGQGPWKRVLLVAPKHPDNFWCLEGMVELMGARALVPNPALPTLMALTPPGLGVEYRLQDENVGPLALDTPCDLVAVTGNTLHAARVIELCRAFRARGVPVALGGTWASVHAERGRELADHLFLGEAELTWPRFLQDWAAGRAQAVYAQEGPVDLALSPAPDFSLQDPRHYVSMSVQASRGCNHRCDFCDVVTLFGRHRVKPVEQVLREVQAVHALGARSVFITDDNFIGHKEHARALLEAIIAWNTRQTRPLSFSTQLALEVADDEDLLQKLADARFSVLFMGLESVRAESLDEVQKGHNLRRDPRERLRRLNRHGLVPFLGLIVGFDHDDATVFDEIFAFMQTAAAPAAGVSLLAAPRGTPLHARLQAEGRLLADEFAGEWHHGTNVLPKQMSPAELAAGHRDLLRRLYAPEAFEARFAAWLGQIEELTDRYPRKKTDWPMLLRSGRLFRYFLTRAPADERGLFLRCLRLAWRKDKRLVKRAVTLLAQYHHFHAFARRG
ncbi:MAG TPA: DUF4070 domain-containing protein [Myxococcota bacterium]|nr:DUF4070 domain-containing protein [Myxococcota bacterium]HRY96801.1 DUF4070 domain-containing protein [Myxococcota bacterium]HSA23996.1 DUF4070 domain-containing protein [Myxococcota bacterium]